MKDVELKIIGLPKWSPIFWMKRLFYEQIEQRWIRSSQAAKIRSHVILGVHDKALGTLERHVRGTVYTIETCVSSLQPIRHKCQLSSALQFRILFVLKLNHFCFWPHWYFHLAIT